MPRVLQEGIRGYLDKVRAVRAFFDASKNVPRQEFATFTRSILTGPAIRALAWVPRVSQSERAEHEAEVRRSGIAGYQIQSFDASKTLEPRSQASEYFPVLYSSLTGVSFGLDLKDGGVRQEVIERARDSHSVATSGRIELRHRAEGGPSDFGSAAVHRQGLPHDTVAERRQNLAGIVQGVFQTSMLVEGILSASPMLKGLDLYLFADHPETPLYFHSSRAREVPAAPQPRATIEKSLHQVSPSRWAMRPGLRS